MDTLQPEPMSVWQIIGRSFQLYANNFLRFLAIVAVVYIPWLLLKLGLSSMMPPQIDKTTKAGFPSLLIFFAVSGVLITFVSNAAIFKSVSGLYTHNKVTFFQAYRNVWARLGTILTAAFILMLLYACAFALPMGALLISRSVMLLHAELIYRICFALVILSAIAPLVILVLAVLWFAVTVQCIMAENLSAWKALKRSKKLVKGNMGRVFVLIILLLAISITAHWPIRILSAAIASTFSHLGLAGASVATNLLYATGSVVIGPITALAMALLYYDLRVRKQTLQKMQVATETEEVKPWWDTWPKQWRQE